MQENGTWGMICPVCLCFGYMSDFLGAEEMNDDMGMIDKGFVVYV
jgi:hypothetical protein